ncbi:pentatricopeptide repeat-containing protein At5g50990 [Prosopis cineraria]|uniref:pentatricopeptide repeat-containing protein At5g50990 n=1 Tax=Prosopis cineraria TaxID=364024 RepID=UPI00240F2F8C|nr:pentatricopeptide repeat-containing protein At5g50990 [Prosopis cineraria]
MKTTATLWKAGYGAKRFASSSESPKLHTNGSLQKLLSPSAAHNSLTDDHKGLCRVLEACRISKHFKTAAKTHARVIVLGYGTYPSLVASLILTYARLRLNHITHQVVDCVLCSSADLFTMNLLIESIMKAGECHIAKKVFNKMPVRNVVSWNSMIGGYVKNSRFSDAMRLFREMLSSEVEPDGFTFASMITGCARLGALSYSEWVHNLMIEKRLELNYILSSALIDMYANCGRINVARELFESVRRDDVSVWNSMINGLATHGLALDAFALFSRMKMENVYPDSITFIGILAACSHCGLVEEGRKYFNLMQSYFSIQPQLEHYGAMVDLLGRSGLLEEAYAIIKEMPMKPDVVIWRALLSACRTHRKKELGEIAISNISRIESGDYVLLSNMYCSLNKWDSSERVRHLMRMGGVRKIRGKSWIELGGTVHQFKAADKSHAEIKAIYRVLEGLIQRAKLEGFMPLTELVLMDVSEEEKEENLSFHSEKLALAYGILKSSPGTEIRIWKNLRICQDCHSLMKISSRVLNRVILMRDRIRFHHFEGGLCSCGDYW